MSTTRRTERLNSLLKQVIGEVIRKDVRNPHIGTLLTVTNVDITKDLHHAKVSISVIGSAELKEQTLGALQASAGFIAVQASKKVVMRYFPALTFKIDDTVDQQMRIDALLNDIQKERESRDSE
ncbi:MAG: 30S ribosome-binding factor RbfA [Parachlamydiales bacterium]|nr:30S ribosome-binding factor RbfA [Parachlamydiales bacterium]